MSSSARRALLVVDMSVEQVKNVSYRKASLLKNICLLADDNFFALRLDCRLWFDGSVKSSLQDLYPDVGLAANPGALLIPDLTDDLRFVAKYHYSSFAGGAKLDSVLREATITEVYIVGINTDYCVLLTAVDAFALGYRVFVVEDAVSSVCGKAGHEEGFIPQVSGGGLYNGLFRGIGFK